MHRWYLAPRQSCSKGAGGLSVWPQEPRIFTGNSVSLSLCWRQRGSRYAIRAGRNLPDKEFRYLRTVIVTAAVYRGFDSELAPLLLTFRHRAGVRPYTSSCDFAEPCVFSKQSPPPTLCPPQGLAPKRGPLLPKLRGQFAEFLQHHSLKRLGMLYQSTCVGLGYGLDCRCCFPEVPGRPPNPIRANDFRPSSHSGRRRNINPLPIGYGSRPRLRGPANPARINLAQEPLDFRREGLSPSLSLLMSAFALPMPPAAARAPASSAYGTLRYRGRATGAPTRSFGAWLEPRYIFGAGRLIDQW